MTIQQALKQGYHQLAESSNSARLDTDILLCHALQCNTAKLLTWPEQALTKTQQQDYLNCIKKRQQGMPVAYITHCREFWSLALKVTEATLIPRPETELLVETILSKFDNTQKISLVDLGTGSGAIAIAIACERPDWAITATDISSTALEIAQYNARKHQQNTIQFYRGRWFKPLRDKRFDIIVSNPPYIAAGDKHLSLGDVRFEPPQALSSGSDGMNDINHLCKHAQQHIKPGGMLIFEHGYNQQQPVLDCLRRNTFKHLFQNKDLAEHVRVSGGQREKSTSPAMESMASYH